MTKGGYKSFSKKDFGQIIYIAIAVCLLAVGVLLLIQKDIAVSSIILGLKILATVCGAGIITGYFFNARTRFRPCWTLISGILFFLTGAGFLFSELIESISTPNVSLSTVVMLLTFVNGCALIATAVQLFSLKLRRWAFLAVYSIVSFLFLVLLYFDGFSLRTNAIVSTAVFMFIIAVQLVTEGVIDFLKVSIKKRNNEMTEGK